MDGDKLHAYMKARAAGNQGEMARIIGLAKGRELTEIARAVKAAEPGEETMETPEIAAAPETPKPKAVKPKAQKKAKKAKPPKKPAVVHTWGDSKERGKAVYTPTGKAVILKEDRTHVLVRVDGTDEQKAVSKKSIRYKAFNEDFRERYTKSETRTPSGAKSVSIGDTVAKALNGLTTAQLADIAAKAGVADRFKAWKGLNPGMQRMNLGNVLRAAAKKDESKKAVAQALGTAQKMERTPPPEKKVKKAKAAKKAKKAPAKAKAAQAKQDATAVA